MTKNILFLGILLGLFLGCDEEVEKIIKKPEKANLSFEKLEINGKTISTKQIFAQIKEKEKAGFQMKSLVVDDSEIAEVQGEKPNFSILIKKAGTFKITLILEKAGFEDVKIVGEITIIKKIATFEKLTITNGAKTISKNQILGQIKGLTNLDYQIKSIEIPAEQSDFAEVKNDFSIEIKKVGIFTAKMILEKSGKLNVAIENCTFEIQNKTFTFEKLTKNDGNKIITKNEILAQIRGLTNLDYQIKNIEIPSEKSDFAEVKNDFSIEIKKLGNFTAKIILEKDGFLDVEIQNCTFEIKQRGAFIFEKLTIIQKVTITKNEILGQITGLTNLDYQIKSIEISDSDKAEVEGSKPHFSIKIKSVGNFTAKIILEKSGKQDIVLNDCAFEIKQRGSLIFQKLKITNGKKMITKNEILAKIQGEKAGYTLKSITISDISFARVSGTKPDFQINILKTGIWTAYIILEKAGNLDRHIAYCKFEIGNKSFDFQKISKNNGEKMIMKNEILGQIQGKKTGYQIKNIIINHSDFAEAKNDFSIEIKKAGNWTANILLEKVGFLDVAIPNCGFEIQNKSFIFQKITKTNGEKMIMKNEILAQIQGEKAGYQIKNIIINHPDFAEAKNDFSIEIKKAGIFTANIILEKVGFLDVAIPNCGFEIQNKNASFEKITKKYSGAITKNEILGQIRGLTGLNYTLKNIVINHSDFAEAKNDFSIEIKKAGNFTANIILEKVGFLDVVLNNCEFEIQKSPAPILSFDPLKIPLNMPITENKILKNVVGSKMGYVLKSISDLRDLSGVNVAELLGTKNIKIKKFGKFTAKIILGGNPNYQNAEITGCEFEVTKGLLKITGLRNGLPKIYDGKAPKPEGTPVLSGVLAGDVVTLTGIQYTAKGAGTNIPIKIKSATLQGKDAGKYELVKTLSGVTQTLESIFEVAKYDKFRYRKVKSKFQTEALSGIDIAALTSIAIPAVIRTLSGLEYVEDNFKGYYYGIGLKHAKMQNVIEEVFLEKGIEIIYGMSFKNFINLKSINIPESIKSIEDSAFQNCRKLVVTFEGNVKPDILKYGSAIAYPFCGSLSCIFGEYVKKIRVPMAQLDAVKRYTGFNAYHSIMEGY